MGIHGIFKQIGAGERISLAKLSANHFTQQGRPFRLAIDISIWLFQIQSGKGGSNPALRTFYYRLLRLLTLNIHPLFVFDGPNKPLFKRNKKVGGPGVRVASVPEFLAKQLLKQFGFPWHVAPGEAEAECALLQREGVVDAVLSEDVDTLMFGSGVTLRNWTSESSSKTPTHVNVYRAPETKAKSGMDREGMILVALMSGGDYLPEGIPGCGPKVACDAARAGFGKELCELGKRDIQGMQEWKGRLQDEIRTNASKFFTRKNTGFIIPEDFPNAEVLGYYTHPCISTPDKVARLRDSLQWDQTIDFPALRSFTADAFDWRCLGGAKKFIRNLAPAMLVRELRIMGKGDDPSSQEGEDAQAEKEKAYVAAIHGKRNHATTDGSLEYRLSFTPANLVPIDLSIEDEDDEFIPAGGEDSEGEEALDFQPLPSTSDDSEAQPTSPSKGKKRTMRPYDPTQLEKVWILKPFLQIGCPLLVEEYEASFCDPKAFMKSRRKARDAVAANEGTRKSQTKTKKRVGNKDKASDMPANALMAYTQVTKVGVEREKQPLGESISSGNSRTTSTSLQPSAVTTGEKLEEAKISAFKLPVAQIPPSLLSKYVSAPPLPLAVSTRGAEGCSVEVIQIDDETTPRPFARFARRRTLSPQPEATGCGQTTSIRSNNVPATPTRRKRRSPELFSPSNSQRTITSYYSPSPRKPKSVAADGPIAFVNLISSSPMKQITEIEKRYERLRSSPNLRDVFVRSSGEHTVLDGDGNNGSAITRNTAILSSPPHGRAVNQADVPFSHDRLPDTVTKRRRKGPLKRYQTAPVGDADDDLSTELEIPCSALHDASMPPGHNVLDAMDLTLATPSPHRVRPLRRTDVPTSEVQSMSDDDLPSLQNLLTHRRGDESRHDKENASYNDARNDDGGTRKDPMPSQPPATDGSGPRYRVLPAAQSPPSAPSLTVRRSPRQHHHLPPLKPPVAKEKKKTAILLRQSLEGAWKEVDAESIDLSGDGSGFKQSGGRAKVMGVGGRVWRKSGVEVLDLTGA